MEKIAKILLDVEAVKLNTKKPFTWTSGIKSPIYTDNRITISYPQHRNRITKELINLINQHFPTANFIVGTATAGIPYASIIASYMNLPLAYVRSSVKQHGMQNAIEGRVNNKAQIVVVEDLLSTGQSVKKVIEALEAKSYQVLGAVAIFSYQLQKLQTAFQNGPDVYSLTNLDELLALAIKEKIISQTEKAEIEVFRNSLSSKG